MAETETCDVCEKPWAARFEWSYTSTEHYCAEHLLEPIEGQPGKTLLDYMPDCQKITHRVTANRWGDPRPPHPPRGVRLHSTRELQIVMLGRMA